jgi:DNA-binding protein Fis
MKLKTKINDMTLRDKMKQKANYTKYCDGLNGDDKINIDNLILDRKEYSEAFLRTNIPKQQDHWHKKIEQTNDLIKRILLL